MAERDTRVLKAPPPHVFVESLTGAGLLLNLRIWASHDDVGERQRTIVEQQCTSSKPPASRRCNRSKSSGSSHPIAIPRVCYRARSLPF